MSILQPAFQYLPKYRLGTTPSLSGNMRQPDTLSLPIYALTFVMPLKGPTRLVLGQPWRSVRSLRKISRDKNLPGSLQPCLTRCPPDLVAIRKAGPRQERTDVAIAVHHGVLKEPTFLQDFLAGMEHERGSDAESGMRPSGTHRSFDAFTKQPSSPSNS